jgi:hypothetical protein
MSRIRLFCEMCFRRLIEPLSTGKVRAVMAKTIQSSDFAVDPSFASLCLGLLVVAMKGFVSIDPLSLNVSVWS